MAASYRNSLVKEKNDSSSNLNAMATVGNISQSLDTQFQCVVVAEYIKENIISIFIKSDSTYNVDVSKKKYRQQVSNLILSLKECSDLRDMKKSEAEILRVMDLRKGIETSGLYKILVDKIFNEKVPSISTADMEIFINCLYDFVFNPMYLRNKTEDNILYLAFSTLDKKRKLLFQ